VVISLGVVSLVAKAYESMAASGPGQKRENGWCLEKPVNGIRDLFRPRAAIVMPIW
jgi:hypothetical protein